MSSNNHSVLSLKELQTGIKDAVHLNFPDYIWVHAELSEVHINQKGHCYIELIEKQSDQTIAKVRATIWSYTFQMLQPYFESATGYEFTSGIKVSLKVVVEFHEVYGLSLNVKDIDPNFTVGDAELQKQKIINQLEEDGVLNMNAELELPLVIQNIAVISSPTAAGYGDWENQIKNNNQGYQIHHQLFEAQMQGSETEASIISALDKIYQSEREYDLVVIIRGGGSKTDLASFDQYHLAANIAQFPLPIITGIGHERDESIADIVAHSAFKTPTAVANFLIDRLAEFEYRLEQIGINITTYAKSLQEEQKYHLDELSRNLYKTARYNLQKNKDILYHSTKQLLRETHNINTLSKKRLNYFFEKIAYESKRIIRQGNKDLSRKKEKLSSNTNLIIERQNRRLKNFEHLNDTLNPKNVLERGFAIIEQNKKIITSSKSIQKNKALKIILKDGEINCS